MEPPGGRICEFRDRLIENLWSEELGRKNEGGGDVRNMLEEEAWENLTLPANTLIQLCTANSLCEKSRTNGKASACQDFMTPDVLRVEERF